MLRPCLPRFLALPGFSKRVQPFRSHHTYTYRLKSPPHRMKRITDIGVPPYMDPPVGEWTVFSASLSVAYPAGGGTMRHSKVASGPTSSGASTHPRSPHIITYMPLPDRLTTGICTPLGTNGSLDISVHRAVEAFLFQAPCLDVGTGSSKNKDVGRGSGSGPQLKTTRDFSSHNDTWTRSRGVLCH